ncbi:gliding motility-associated C-terminal domain-containing protein [Flavobacteriaceae bacterium]|nr:gliding motility-associated C-terminal domain-containing protein [Flavobacteriaceae bacterium]
MTIKNGAILFVRDLELNPTSDLTLSNLEILKQTSSPATNSILNISKVFVFSNALSNYNGIIKVHYTLSDLNSLSPADLQVSLYNSTKWNNEAGSSLNQPAKTVEATLTSTLIKEVTLSALTTSPTVVPSTPSSGGGFVNLDRDGDGYPNNLDAFPDDPNEWSDLDNDGIGDNSDTDIDGDGFSNLDEGTCFTDALDPFDVPGDFDNDGIPNCIDEDDDNDLYSDEDEISCGSNPFDLQDKPLDTDSDLLANCIDPDDDNDNYLDQDDDFPLDNTEWIDTDLDGLGNNTDLDDDNDCYNDQTETEANTDPLDPNSTPPDFDNDCIPDKIDLDYNNDGYSDKELLISQFISANGDGINDYFKVVNIELYSKNTVSIYSRSGILLYQKKGYQNDWFGTHKGELLFSGSYYYTIDIGNDNITNYQGWLYLTR